MLHLVGGLAVRRPRILWSFALHPVSSPGFLRAVGKARDDRRNRRVLQGRLVRRFIHGVFVNHGLSCEGLPSAGMRMREAARKTLVKDAARFSDHVSGKGLGSAA